MSTNIKYNEIIDINEIGILKGREVFNYKHDEEWIENLKKLFILDNSFYILAKNNEDFAWFCSIDRWWWEEWYFLLGKS